MADRSKPLYVVLMDDEASSIDESVPQEAFCSRYTRAALQSTLQLMGCKSRHAFKISNRVFDVLSGPPYKTLTYHGKNGHRKLAELESYKDLSNKPLAHSCLDSGVKKPLKTNRKRSMVVIGREKFLNVVCDALAQYQYVGPNQRADLMLACRVRERKTSVTILLCGTSGCGKSTLSSLLASRLGITTVVSTDSIRHMMRSFVDEETSPLLWASTYHAGEYLDPVAVKEAAVRRKAMKSANSTVYNVSYEDLSGGVQSSTASTGYPEHQAVRELHAKSEQKEDADVSSSTMVIEGFKAQCEMVIDSLDRLITSWEEKNESVVVEGVHLSLNFVMGLMRKHPSIIPFMVHITNEDKHLERFAVRAKYMTLDPSKNKYAKYIGNIRTIQQYLYKRADKHLVPKLNNTNVDKSVAAIHATIFSCLRRREAGEPLYDQPTNTVKVVDQEYRSQYAASSLGSKCMFQLIQRKGSSHHLMALMNTDGSVAKAWPIESIDTSGKYISGNGSETLGSPVYGPLQIAKAEPVNLQFGNFGLSAFPVEASSSVDTPGRDVTEAGNCMNADSPRYGEGAEKELLDEATEFVHEEEAEEVTDCLDSDEDLDENAQKLEDEELEGSVNESMRSDEEETEDNVIDHIEDNDTAHVESNSSDEHDEDYASGSTSLPRIEDLSFYMPNHIRNGFGSCGNDYCSSVNADKVVDFDKLKQPQTAESSVSLYGKEMQSLGKKTFSCF